MNVMYAYICYGIQITKYSPMGEVISVKLVKDTRKVCQSLDFKC